MPSGSRKTQLQVPWCFSLSFDASSHRWGTWWGTAYSGWFSILSTLLLMHVGVHPRLLGFAMVPVPSEEWFSRPVWYVVCPDPSMPWLLLNSGSLWSPHLPARITVYWVLLGLMSYTLAPCQDTHPPRGAGLSEGGLVEAADLHPTAH